LASGVIGAAMSSEKDSRRKGKDIFSQIPGKLGREDHESKTKSSFIASPSNNVSDGRNSIIQRGKGPESLLHWTG
jgi:hypothetical protein